MTTPNAYENRLIINLGILLVASLLLVCSRASAQERTGQVSQPLTTSRAVTLWTTQHNEVPVCWETGGYDREKKISQDAVTGTWEYWANVRFVGWGRCPTLGNAQFVRIRIGAQGPDNAGAGGSARVGTAALSKAADDNPGVNLSFQANMADRGRVEYVAVHEFGHVLGFIHEQDAPANQGPARCNSGVNPNANPTVITHYDRDSIMNYCNREGNMTGNLSDVDIAGVQEIYGIRRQNVATLNGCESAPSKNLASLAGAWNDYGKTSVAVFRSDSSKFLYHSHWSLKDGGWMDDAKWASGDFTGDGKTDLVAAWNNSGHATLTVRSSTGSKFTAAHWLPDAGGWMATSRYLSGDFNGDGKADLAGVWNNGGKTSIVVFLSDGTKFNASGQWSDRDGGWVDKARWFAGDFNGDGKTDIGAAWNNDGIVTLTVRLSDGAKFRPVHWLANGGRWFDSAIYLAGDFNKDGKADVIRMWNDIGQASGTVYISNGSKFAGPAAWSVRDGGWGGIVKWIPGDVNGDGTTDVIALWNHGNQNTITVRLSNGSSKLTAAHWSTNNGGWIDTTAWCAGKFD
jgi:hypothetical protein